ncbi:unnamed protein product, partial [Meganyctiphanes norvegica]
RCNCLHKNHQHGAGHHGVVGVLDKTHNSSSSSLSPCKPPVMEDTPSSQHNTYQRRLHGTNQHHDEDEDEGPDVVKTANETAQLLESPNCPEIIPSSRRSASFHHNKGVPSGANSMGSGPLSTSSGANRLSDIYRDPGSPRHLGLDESFV